jgi:hypothetical protein
VCWPNLVLLSCFDPCRPWFFSPPDLAGLSLFSYFIFWPLFFFPSISAWPRPNLLAQTLLPSTLTVQRRSRSGLSAVIFLPWPARRCSILSFRLPLMCSAPKVPGQVFQHESVSHAVCSRLVSASMFPALVRFFGPGCRLCSSSVFVGS